jgi:hypothetical protein
MNDPVQLSVDAFPQRLRQSPPPGRSTHLIVDNPDPRLVLHEPKHRTHEITAMHRVHPGGPDDERGARSRPDHLLLATQLGAAVDAQRIRGGIGRVGVALPAIEYKIGREVNEAGPDPGGRGGDVEGSGHVDRFGPLHFRLRLVYMGIGCELDHCRRPLSFHDGPYRIGLRHIEIVRATGDYPPRRRSRVLQLAAQLSLRAGYENRCSAARSHG